MSTTAPPSAATARGRKYSLWGFETGGEYATSLKRTPWLLLSRPWLRHDPAGEPGQGKMGEDGEAEPALLRTLNWFHVSMLGVGLILGAGIFVSTGDAAANLAGPAVVFSFLVAGISALLSSLCYSEFAVCFPISGGAFNYILATLGEYAAWLTVATLILEYILANAAVARTWAPYLGQLVNKGSDFFVFSSGGYDIDPMAAALVFLCCMLLIKSTGESSTVNAVITVAHIAVVLFIIIAGFTKANPANLSPFLPFGVKGIFQGSAFVFFSYIGFDCVSTMAEEVQKPERDMPVGIISCIVIVTITYILASLCLVMMVPIQDIDTSASFAAAFEYVGYGWGKYVVAIGALMGIFTGVLVGCMAVSRLLAAVGKLHLLPPMFGKVHSRFHTPVTATVTIMIATIPLALLTDLPALVNLVSAGTLTVFAVVAIALLVKRYFNPDHHGAAALGLHHSAAAAFGPGGEHVARSGGSQLHKDAAAVTAELGGASSPRAGGGKDVGSALGNKDLGVSRDMRENSFLRERPGSTLAHAARGNTLINEAGGSGGAASGPSLSAPAPPSLPGRMWGLRARSTPPPLKPTSKARKIFAACCIVGLCITAACMGAYFALGDAWPIYVVIIAIHVAITIALHIFGRPVERPNYVVPAFPYVPSASLLLNAIVMGSQPAESFVQLILFLAIVTAVYILYGVHGALRLESHSSQARTKRAVELT